MKLALIFLLSLASLSVQQKLRYNPYLQYAFPRALSPSYYYYVNPYARYQPPEISHLYPSEDDESDNYYDIADQLEARVKPQDKNLIHFLQRNPFSTTTTTHTVTVTTSIVTYLSAVIQKCITSTYFAAGASTVSCGRRRRNFFVEEEADHSVAINPSAVNPIELTPIQEKKYRDDTQIESSHDSAAPVRRARWLWRPATVTTTVTSSVNGTTSITTVIKTPVPILSSAATSALSCLPAGYTYC